MVGMASPRVNQGATGPSIQSLNTAQLNSGSSAGLGGVWGNIGAQSKAWASAQAKLPPTNASPQPAGQHSGPWMYDNPGSASATIKGADAWNKATYGTGISTNPEQTFATAQQQMAQQAQQLSTMRDYLSTQLGAQAGGFTGQAADYRMQIDAAARKRDIESGYLRTNTGNALDQLAEGRYRDVDIAAARNQDAHGFTGREFQNLMTRLTGARDIAGRTRSSALDYFGQQRGLTDRNYRLAGQRAGYDRTFAQEDAASAAAAGGSFLSNSLNRPWERANVQFGLANQAAGIARDDAYSSIDRGTRDTNIGYDRSMQDIDAADRDGTLKRDREYQDQHRTHQYLVSLSKTYGLKEADMRAGLEQGLARMGLDAAETIKRLAAAADSSDAQAAAIADMIAKQAASMAGS
jgi:hypothetical protein